jgi:hypothetical protein
MSRLCHSCKVPLDEQGKCPQCGKVKVPVTATASFRTESLQSVSKNVSPQFESGDVPIKWDEIDRLFNKKEYAAAILVTAINVEYTLKRLITELYKSNPNLLQSITNNDIRSKIKSKIEKNKIEELSLATCFSVAKQLATIKGDWLKGDWEKQVSPLIDHRNKIVHQLGYFADFTQLKCISENEVKKLIQDARDFCSANLVNRFTQP